MTRHLQRQANLTTLDAEASSRASAHGKMGASRQKHQKLQGVSFDRGAVPPEIPVTAHSTLLRKFAEDLQPSTTKKPNTTGLTDAFMSAVRDYCTAMQPGVKKEKTREEIVLEHLPKLFAACGVPFNFKVYQSKSSYQSMVDIALVPAAEAFTGPIAGRTPDTEPPCAIIEVKGEPGSSGEPWPQLVTYYSDHVDRSMWVGEEYASHVCNVSRFPMILSAVDGPMVSHGAGVIGMVPTTQQLSHPEPHFETGDRYHLVLVAANLRAWIRAIDALAAEYRAKQAIELSDELDAELVFPELTVDGETVVFLEHLARGVFRASWNHQLVVVKICRHNNNQAQRWTAGQVAGGPKESLAPKILHTESLPGSPGVPWHIIVMEDLWVQGFDPLTTHVRKHSLQDGDAALIRDGVTAALERLYEDKGPDTDVEWVFFDLRAPNVMVRRKDDGVWDVRLIDFGMCGKTGEHRPRCLNSGIEWPPWEEDGVPLLRRSDDTWMLDRLMK